MATNHIFYDKGSEYGRLLKDALRSLENGVENLNDTLAVMEQMKLEGGANDNAATYAVIATRFGFTDGAAAMAAFNELASLRFKLSRGAGEGDETGAAMAQAFAKFR